ncbi:MAG: zinc ribbon domain-containing protein [Ignavibacteriales bacterium]|nr:zinc ribbon domain-containing protein [Ignavibacteriales bacterium]
MQVQDQIFENNSISEEREYECSDCGTSVLENDNVCPQCGASLEETISLDGINHDERNNNLQPEATTIDGYEIGVGFLWLIGGIIVTVVTYNIAAPGGSYIIALGPILHGALKVIKGLFS